MRFLRIFRHKTIPAIVDDVGCLLLLVALSGFGATYFLNLWTWDLSIPFVYFDLAQDDVWQFVLTKALRDTGWVFRVPFLGTPDIADWHYHPYAQTSPVHSVLMLGLSYVLHDPIEIQQCYYLMNFPLIAATSYLACRLLNISRLLSISIGLLFAFTGTRINFSFYAFLSNYFAIPLGIIPVIWVLTGRLHPRSDLHLPHDLDAPSDSQSSWIKRCLLGLVFILLITLSDGYFAFFTLLLLCFSILIRAAQGDILRPVRLLIPVFYVVVLLSAALILQIPLNEYRRDHPEEFAPNGIEDQDLKRKPFEAEVYSSSLKILVAPVSNHRITPLGRFGERIMGTVNDARRIPILRPTVQLGSLATLLLFGAFLIAAAWMARLGDESKPSPAWLLLADRCQARITAMLLLSFFVLLCSTSGGIGPLIALVFPTIRAYDRFPLFLIFFLYLSMGVLITRLLEAASPVKRPIYAFLVVAVTVLALFDQVPGSVVGHSAQARSRFLAERAFVNNIAAALPSEAMVYQYPYSQYLTRSPYYGWGSFSHVRLAIHADSLRWSNGASKNSPVDAYHARTARLPLQDLLAEIEALGFQGIVVDRVFLPSSEFEAVASMLTAHTGARPVGDEQGRLAFWPLPNRGYRLQYDRAYIEPERLVIVDPLKVESTYLPRAVNRDVLTALLRHSDSSGPLTIERANHPELFVPFRTRWREVGDLAVVPHSDLRGDVLCRSNDTPIVMNGAITVTIRNRTDFNWQLGQGRFPIGLGVHIENTDGTMLVFSSGYRVPSQAIVPKGGQLDLTIPLASIDIPNLAAREHRLILAFDLLQENNAWFSRVGPNEVCRVLVE